MYIATYIVESKFFDFILKLSYTYNILTKIHNIVILLGTKSQFSFDSTIYVAIYTVTVTLH